MSTVAVDYDPYSPAVRADPYRVYRALRDNAPVYRNPEHGFYALTRHADVFWAASDWRSFSSADGVTLEGLPPDLAPEMIMMDPPRHDELRDIVKAAFTPKRIAVLEKRIREIAIELVDAFDPDDLDFVRDLTLSMPMTVMAELLGVPLVDQAAFRSWADALTMRDVRVPETLDRARVASAEISAYLTAVIVERRTAATDDVIGTLVRAGGDERLDDQEILGFCRLLLLAGGETTVQLIGNGLFALGRSPDQRAAVLADPTLIPSAVEETLRYEAPVQALARTVTVDTERHGVLMAAGARVLLVYGSANRDEREFDDPDRFDVHRPLRSIIRHVAFGHGIHHCIGAALARIEGRQAFEQVLRRFPNYEIEIDEIEPVPSGMVRGPKSLPVRAGG